MPDSSTITRTKRRLNRLLTETHHGNYAVIDEIVHPDVVTHGFFGMDATDREGYRRFFEAFDETFGDQEFVVEELIGSGETVAVRFSMSGVHRGTILGVEPTGNRLSWTGTAIDRFDEDGRLVEAWLYPDMTAILVQLGMIDDPSSA